MFKPDVKNTTKNLIGRFFRDDPYDMIEIEFKGTGDTWIGRATPEHLAMFPGEYEAYQQGQAEFDPGGTPLTEVPGIDKKTATAYKLKGIRNAEELEGVSAEVIARLGTGAITNQKVCKLYLAQKRTEPSKPLKPSKAA